VKPAGRGKTRTHVRFVTRRVFRPGGSEEAGNQRRPTVQKWHEAENLKSVGWECRFPGVSSAGGSLSDTQAEKNPTRLK